jgi:hypothetical protein
MTEKGNMQIMFKKARGTLNDIIEKLAGEEASVHLERLKAVGRGENPFPVNVVSVPGRATWQAKGDLIFITLPPSEGVTGPQWIEYFDELDIKLSDDAQTVLRSGDFQPAATGTIHRLVALRATFWKKDPERTTRAIQDEGAIRKWLETQPEAVCIFRKCFSDKQLEKMGLLWIVGIHKPIEVGGSPRFLFANRGGGGRWLYAVWAYPGDGWNDKGAFFWSLPQETQP